MPDRWVVEPSDNGLRLDKFLASPDRLGSRGRAVDALARGKVFLNHSQERRMLRLPKRLPVSGATVMQARNDKDRRARREWVQRPAAARAGTVVADTGPG